MKTPVLDQMAPKHEAPGVKRIFFAMAPDGPSPAKSNRGFSKPLFGDLVRWRTAGYTERGIVVFPPRRRMGRAFASLNQNRYTPRFNLSVLIRRPAVAASENAFLD